MIKVPLVKKRTLKKAVDVAALKVVLATAVNVANRRKQVPPPFVPQMADVEAFFANEPVEAIPVNVVEPAAKEPIQALGGPIPSVHCHPLGSNIKHILDEIDLESKESVGMGDNHTGPSNAAVEKTPQKPLTPILEARASSRAPTPKRPQSLIFKEDDSASRSKRPRASEASESESLVEIRPEWAN